MSTTLCPSVASLVAFIRAHDGCQVHAVVTGPRLEVSSIMVDAHGIACRVSEQIKATPKAVRDWLGY